MRPAPANHYARSREGLWVRGVRAASGALAVEAQVRTVWAGNTWQRLDADGVVIATGGASSVRYEEPWQPLGPLPLPLALAQALAPLAALDWLGYGVMRHAAELVAGGWGASAAEAVGWFAALPDGAWVVTEAPYVLVGPLHAPWPPEFAGARLHEVTWDAADATLRATIVPQPGLSYPIALEGLHALGAFVMGAVPLV